MADERWIPITYEKLPDFCYSCGRLGHVVKDCDEHLGTENSQLQYGSWLRAPVQSYRSRIGREIDFENRIGRGRGRGKRNFWYTEDESPETHSKSDNGESSESEDQLGQKTKDDDPVAPAIPRSSGDEIKGKVDSTGIIMSDLSQTVNSQRKHFLHSETLIMHGPKFKEAFNGEKISPKDGVELADANKRDEGNPFEPNRTKSVNSISTGRTR